LLFNEGEIVTVENSTCLFIKSIGSTSLQIDTTTFCLSNILHYSHASMNLMFINKFYVDNNCYFILTGSDFIMKENQTSQTLLHGLVDNGLYPIIDVSSLPHKPYGLTAMIEEKLLLSNGTII